MTDLETQVKSLHYKRGNIKSQLTLFQKFIEPLTTKNLSSLEIINLEQRTQKFEQLHLSFDKIQTQIEEFKPEDDSNMEEREMFQDNYFALLAQAKQLITINSASQSTRPSDGSSNPQTLFKASNLKLPRISIPFFNGNFSQWRTFHDTFCTIVHNNSDLTNVQKLCYLRSALKGEPEGLISSLETIDSNYSIAWKMLQDRYNNKRRIVYNHVREILDIGNITKESFSSLRHLIDTVQRNLSSLNAMQQPVTSWDAILVPIIISKLDFTSIKEWESFLSKQDASRDNIPTVNEFLEFLNNRQNVLESLSGMNRGSVVSKSSVPYQPYRKSDQTVRSLTTTIEAKCLVCDKNHLIHCCDVFLQLPVSKRMEKAKELKCCINCLKTGHYARFCNSGSCRKCHRKHNTLLHISTTNIKPLASGESQEVTTQVTNSAFQPNQVQPLSTSTIANCSSIQTKNLPQILLSTACVQVVDNFGNNLTVKAILDSASQSNFISEDLCKALNLKQFKTHASVTGINQKSTKILRRVELTVLSLYKNCNLKLSCLVIPKITENIPAVNFDASLLDIPPNLTLADPTFNISSKIDLLIGSTEFWNLLSIGQHELGPGKPILHKTKLGWIVAGFLNLGVTETERTLAYLTLNELHDEVSRFWEVDEITAPTKHLSTEEKYCEEFFKQTTIRDANGRFIVRIPLKQSFETLGDSYQTAKKRLHSLELKLQANSSLKMQYVDFMSEYKTLGHMTELKDTSTVTYFLPHHFVLKDSVTTNLRVVFDGSCKTSSGVSLNDLQLAGPSWQDDIFSIIVRFRFHAYVMTADISKMYRQVLINHKDRHLQNIVWRSDDEIRIFQLNTITYGTKSGPYLATRCLHQLALDFEDSYPKEAEIIKNDFYIDDLITGSESIENLRKIRDNIRSILSSAGFVLRKWCSNVPSLLFTASEEPIEHEFVHIGDSTIKTLGICWDPRSDNIYYHTNNLKVQECVTKRSILASTAQLFDPMGLLAPALIVSKLIIQELWKLKITWDESIPTNLHTKWLKFRDKLKYLSDIRIPRHVLSKNLDTIEIHGFSDASERAYGASVYVRCKYKGNISSVFLLAAKSRVAPLKNVTLPRLELNAALLLAQLIGKIRKILTVKISKEYLWCDSIITLCWIRASPAKWKTYVANRVSEIQTLTNVRDWYHVKSSDNPADLISRGLMPENLLNSKLWWNGPEFLKVEFNPCNEELIRSSQEMPETRAITLLTNVEYDIFRKFSNLKTLINVVAYCYRFYNNLKGVPIKANTFCINALEKTKIFSLLIKLCQLNSFPTELKLLKQNKTLNSSSKLLNLKPFLDHEGVLRVGGRLALSNLNFEQKHQIILCNRHPFTILIARHEHIRLLHCGAQTLLYELRQGYWPLSGRNLTRKIVHDCIKCFKSKPKPSKIYMGNLPRERIIPSPAFYNSGVDFAGPLKSRDRRARGYKIYKSYICLFVCLNTKAIHIELVSELTSECFLAALRRFVARRGKPHTIFSDNGSNFVATNRELQEMFNFLKINLTKIQEAASNEGILWKFIPANSPHFGGIWEAGIKSAKTNLKRVIGDSILTFEEYQTVLIQIEAVLNSRPLSPLSNDPSDLNPLTPAHFLIGRSLVSVPDHDLLNIPLSRLSHYQQLQNMVQHFWKRWQREYLTELQMRKKWNNPVTQIKLGDLVVLIDDNRPPCNWKLGRIINVHPGSDGVVRVVSIKTSTSEVKRAINKICILPIDSYVR